MPDATSGLILAQAMPEAMFQQMMPLVLIMGVFYVLLIRPQQQKQKEMRSMLNQLKRGDRVVTGGGILGTVQRVPMVQDKDGKQVASNEIEVELAPNVKVTVPADLALVEALLGGGRIA